MGSPAVRSEPAIQAGLRMTVISRSVFPLHGVGGLERHTHDLVKHLAQRHVAVSVITRPPSHTGTRDGWPGLPVVVFTVPYVTFPGAGRRGTTVIDRSTAYPLFGYRAGRLAARLAAAGSTDLVYGLGAAAFGYALARRHRPETTVPWLFNPQGLEEFGGLDGAFGGQSLKRIGYAPLRSVVRVCARAADRVIATDRAIEPAVARHLAVGPDRMRLIPNAIDVAAVMAHAGAGDAVRLRARYGIGPDEMLLVSVGRIERNKGFHLLADALALVADRPWHWVLVGDGPHRQVVDEHIRESGISGRVILTGRVDDATLHAWYEAANLFVHPTQYEGSSLVTLEAMAHGRAVLATLAGGLPDKVRPGETGWLVAPGDVPALADGLRTAFDASPRLPAMGVAGRALVAAEFSWTAVIDRFLAVCRELLAPSRTS